MKGTRKQSQSGRREQRKKHRSKREGEGPEEREWDHNVKGSEGRKESCGMKGKILLDPLLISPLELGCLLQV